MSWSIFRKKGKKLEEILVDEKVFENNSIISKIIQQFLSSGKLQGDNFKSNNSPSSEKNNEEQ